MTHPSTTPIVPGKLIPTVQGSHVSLITHALFLIHPYLVDDCGLSFADVLFLLSTCKYFSLVRLKHISKMKLNIELGSPLIRTVLQGLGPNVKSASLDNTRWIGTVIARVPNPDKYVHLDYEYRKLLSTKLGCLSQMLLSRHFCSQDFIHFMILKRLDIRSVDFHVPWELLVNLEQLKCDFVCFTPDCHPPKLRVLNIIVCNEDFAEIRCCRSLSELTVETVARIGPARNYLAKDEFQLLERLEVQNWASMNLNNIGLIPSLRFIEIEAEYATNVSMAIYHQHLEELSLVVPNAMDITPLKSLTSLTSLFLVSHKLVDTSPLHNLINLEFLGLCQSIVSDFTPLASLVNLREIDLREASNLNSIDFISSMPLIHTIDMFKTRVSDLSPLKNCFQLKYLNLEETAVSDISALKNLTLLSTLLLNMTMVSDLSPLTGLTALEELDVSYTQVSNLNPIAHSTKMKELRASDANVTNEGVMALVSLQCLKRVCLSDNIHFSDLSFLRGHKTLKELVVSNTAVADVSPLAEIFTLENLYCYHTKITTLEPLREIRLQILQCEHRLFDYTVANWKECKSY
ncbi:L domain-like protein [Rhizoclosmatium globosum]|uniref:L domain-like protein n=1 Tax=Rhizoclosmatium globosum TaxID=329046 RepID=A0A1Y2C176_9FUNG|nr:L domain-like protein [Rhizoclosmatium globosum]|eukprot:ORY40771.1 L domain-like protein [Rhizoclosmatium globosum]